MKILLLISVVALLGCGMPGEDKKITVTLKDTEISSAEEIAQADKIKTLEERVDEQDKKIDELLSILADIQKGNIKPVSKETTSNKI